MSERSAFPYPIPEYGAEAYWAACNDERLVMQQCTACKKYRWHPSPLCTFCADDAFTWTQLSGRASVKTWTVVTHPVHPAAVTKVPYVVVEVEIEEQAGLTMLSNLIDTDESAIDFDLPLEVVFKTHPSGQKLPMFKPRA